MTLSSVVASTLAIAALASGGVAPVATAPGTPTALAVAAAPIHPTSWLCDWFPRLPGCPIKNR